MYLVLKVTYKLFIHHGMKLSENHLNNNHDYYANTTIIKLLIFKFLSLFKLTENIKNIQCISKYAYTMAISYDNATLVLYANMSLYDLNHTALLIHIDLGYIIGQVHLIYGYNVYNVW